MYWARGNGWAIALLWHAHYNIRQPTGAFPVDSTRLSTTSVDFGVGILLLAASEVVKLASGQMPTPPIGTMNLTDAKVIDRKNIKLTFDETLDTISAQKITAYTINGNSIEDKAISTDNAEIVISFISDIPGGNIKNRC